jgi:uncharacterized protein YukE
MKPEVKAALLEGIEELAKDIEAENLEKRFGNFKKEAITRGAFHIGKAVRVHGKAMKACKAAMKAHNEMLEGMGKMLGGLQKLFESSREALEKAEGTASESMQPTLRQVKDHLEQVHKEAGTLHIMHEKMAKAHKALRSSQLKTADHQELAKGYFEKVTTGWVGESGESPSAAAEGYTPTIAGKENAQSTMTEGEVPQYDPTKPYKSAGNGNLNKNGNSAGDVALREENAFLKGKLEAIENLPAETKPVQLFRVGGGNLGETQEDDDIVSVLLKGKVNAAERRALAAGDDDMRKRLSARAIGMLASSALRGDPRFAKGLHELKTPAALVDARASAMPRQIDKV